MSLLRELKRRGVVQVGVAYTVTAWLLVQVADVVLPAFDAPDWAMRGLIILLLAGFPVALLLSWVFDLTSRGFVRTEEMEASGEIALLRGQRLNHAIIVVLSIAVVMFALDRFVWQSQTSLVPDDTVVAVLPFRNVSGDESNQVFSFGMHDDLLTQLSKISGFRTLSRSSVMRYRDTDQSIPEIAGELGADVVLEGGVQRAEDLIRVSAQLVEPSVNTNLWAETYDQSLDASSIFSIQSSIARSIAAALKVELTGEEEARLAAVPTSSLQAWEDYSRGRQLLGNRNLSDLEAAATAFRSAIEEDQQFAAAWAGLCRAELMQYREVRDPVHFEAGEAACQEALALDDQSAEVFIAIGGLHRLRGQYSRAEVALQSAEYARAQQALETAMSLDGLKVEAMVELGMLFALQNRPDDALAQLQEAIEFDPQSWDAQMAMFGFYYRDSDDPDRFEKALVHAKAAAAIRPDIASSWNNVGVSHYMLNNFDAAADAYRQSIAVEPSRSAYTNTGLALYYTGDFEESARMQRKAIELAPLDHRVWGRLGDALHELPGREQDMLEAYEEAARLAALRLEVNDRDASTWGMMGFYLAILGRDDEALAAASKGVDISSGSSSSYYYAGLVQASLGLDDEAIESLAKSVEQDPAYRYLVANEPTFRNRLSDHPAWTSLSGTEK